MYRASAYVRVMHGGPSYTSVWIKGGASFREKEEEGELERGEKGERAKEYDYIFIIF